MTLTRKKRTMNDHLIIANPSAFPHLFKSTPAAAILATIILLLGPQRTEAGSATWNASPLTANWNTSSNWTPATVPNDISHIATFGVSNKKAVSLSATATVDRIVFNSGASAFTITTKSTGSVFALQ